ncbi:MAG: hypothetical protein KAI79_18070 [Bacteroidales bacterium]|nr:hypothetical protein [Bacteroidales bacterium]
MYSSEETYSTKSKALNINLRSDVYGTLAEIGGGQEVARAFFQAGGASGTVAKSISAYDKTFSDYLYNNKKPGRYVSSDRLIKMLNKEHNELVSLLSDKCTSNTKFFVFADTVETINYAKTNQGSGWMGVKFQMSQYSEPNEIIVHVRLLENDSLLQQYTLGALGVNLIYAAFNYYKYPNKFLSSLMDNLSNDRVDINMVKMSGPELDYVDNRLLSVQLVKNGMTPATMFDKNGEFQQPYEMLYKKNVLLFRGKFNPITHVAIDMLKSSCNLFKKSKNYETNDTIGICEITLNNLLESGHLDERDFLDRVDILNELGQNVMISNFEEYYKLAHYFSDFKLNRLRIVLGIPALKNILNEKYYTTLKGGIMEAFANLFQKNIKLYVYPGLDNGNLTNSKNIKVPDNIKGLYQYLKENRKIVDIEKSNPEYLNIYSREVLKMIQEGKDGWENFVPKEVAEKIRLKRLFGLNTK